MTTADRLPTATVVEGWRRSYDDPIRMTRGDRLLVEDRPTEWPGWLWVTGPDGRSGWVPETYVRRDGEHGEAVRDFDAMELTVTAGESVTVRESAFEWCLVTSATGTGWVPAEKLRLN